VSNLRKYYDLGADLVVISGGKGLRGPQSAGLILGRRDLIEACAANSNPNDFIGRPLKVGKEELVGMVVALEIYLNDISKRERETWEQMVGHVVEALQDLSHVKTYRHFPYKPSRDVPIAVVELEAGLGMTLTEVEDRLNTGDPPIYVGPVELVGTLRERGVTDAFIINPHTMKEGEELQVANRLRQILADPG
jgi:L-seryl-tRNA(Ser) seleniumtransferase